MAIFMIFISFYFSLSIAKALISAVFRFPPGYKFGTEIDLAAVESACARMGDNYIYKYVNEIAINIGTFRLFLAFCIIKCKGTEDIIQGLSKLDDILKVSVFQILK